MSKTHRMSWSRKLELALLDLWEDKLPDLKGSRRNTHVYREMADSMVASGVRVQWADIKTKIDNMTRKYRQAIERSDTSWEHYDRLKAILGDKLPSKVIKVYLDDENTSEDLVFEDKFDSEYSNTEFIFEECDMDMTSPKIKDEDKNFDDEQSNHSICKSTFHDEDVDLKTVFNNDSDTGFQPMELKKRSLSKKRKAELDTGDRYAKRMLQLAEIRTENLVALTNDTIHFHKSLLELFEQYFKNHRK